MRPMFTVKDVARLAGTNEHHVRRLCRDDRIPHFKIGGLYRFDPNEISAWLSDVHVTLDAVTGAARE